MSKCKKLDFFPGGDLGRPSCLVFKVIFLPVQKQKADTEVAKQKEIEALQNQLQQLKDMAAGKAVSH